MLHMWGWECAEVAWFIISRSIRLVSPCPDLLQLCQRHHHGQTYSPQMTWVFFFFFSLSVFPPSGKMNSSPDIQSNCLGLWEYEGSWELQELQRQHFYIAPGVFLCVRNHRGQPGGREKEQPREEQPRKNIHSVSR